MGSGGGGAPRPPPRPAGAGGVPEGGAGVSKPYAHGAGGSVAALSTDTAAAHATTNRTDRYVLIICPPFARSGVYNPWPDGAHAPGHRARRSVAAVSHARRSSSARRQTQSQRARAANARRPAGLVRCVVAPRSIHP